MEYHDSENSNEDEYSIFELANRDAGEEPTEPYRNVNISQLPTWWQQAIIEHEEYGLRPYRPPRFSDGTLSPVLIKRLERELEVDINLLGLDAQYPEDWTIQVDGERITEIGRRRSPDGYTLFEMTSNKFEDIIKNYLIERV